MTSFTRLHKETTGLILVDVQGKLAEQMPEFDGLIQALTQLIKGAQLMGLPIIAMEQLPDKLGPTRHELRPLLTDAPLSKSTFSGMATPTIEQAIEAAQRNQWLVAGIEAHVCVYQTVMDLLEERYQVHLVTDAIRSRHPDNRRLAVDKMLTMGADVTSVEMALFELQQQAGGDVFKQLIQLIK